jgi:uncharacterized protein (DUF1499 family)
MFKFSGKRPKDLGVRGGQFTAARSWKPNWVSSQVEPSDPHYIAPLKARGDGKGALAALARLIQAQPRTRIVEQKDGYLYAEFSTPLMGYTDDVEFAADGHTVHVRSSSRLGIRDLGVNRRRIEALRAEFEKP